MRIGATADQAHAGSRGASPSGRRSGSPSGIVAIACMCGIIVALSQTLIIPLISSLPGIFHASADDASWAITATLLTASVATPISGRLGDMFGKRRMLVISMVCLLVGGVVSALSTTLMWMVIGRGLQGLAMGTIALGISVLRDELPADRVGSGVARMSATMGIGGAVGMPLAAFIADKAEWQALFWLTAAVAGLGALAIMLVIPESPIRKPAPFDFVGALGLGAALTMLLLAITKGGDWGWGDRLTLVLLGGSLLVFLVWGAWELRRTSPLVDLRVSAVPQVLFTNVASVAIGFAMYGMSLIPVQILMAPKAVDYGLGLTMTQAGLIMAPAGVLMYLTSSIGARLTREHGPRTSLAVGVAVIGLGYVSMIFLRQSAWQVCVATAIIGAGVGVAYAAMPALIMGAVPVTQTAAANGLNSLMRSVGTSLSSAVVAVVLTQNVVPVRLPGAGVVALATHHGFTLTILISLGASAGALLLTFLIPRGARAMTPLLAGRDRPARSPRSRSG